MSNAIEDYAMVGDRHTAALISSAGSVDWLCFPRFDSQACFAALLGDEEHGRWLLSPRDEARTTRRYVEGTVVLETTHETDTGTVRVTDVMHPADGRADLVRRVEGISGTVTIAHEWIVRLGYGAILPWLRHEPDPSDHGGDEALVAVVGPDMLILRGPRLPKPEGGRHVDEFDIAEGEVAHFSMVWSKSYEAMPQPIDVEARLKETIQESRDWIDGGCGLRRYADAVDQSLLILRAMTHAQTGGIVAAPTTSLPEELGGSRNWDYRYTWLRDAAQTVQALLSTGLRDRSVLWRDWLLRAVAGDPDDLQIMYTVDGSREMPERELDHLPGYADSVPVRVGNEAVNQRQTDVLGEVMIALEMLRGEGVEETEDTWRLQRSLIDDLAEDWYELDHGLWEMRGDKQAFTHSRVMVWVAMDRGLRAIDDHGFEGPTQKWREVRDTVREEVLSQGFNSEINSFTQHYETTEVDASLLVMPITGFIEPDDPRFVGTVERIEAELMRDGLVLRYRATSDADGLDGDEHPFLICNFWLVRAYASMGRLDDATELFERLLSLRNDVGLMAEEYDVKRGRQMGNFPQAFSHLGLVQAAVALDAAYAAGSGAADGDESSSD
ncbi:MAG: glycoside hydrolase family 15 protein [Ornithinimicrobium sp.]